MTSALFRNPESRSAIERAYDRLLEDTPQARSRRVPTRFGETHMLVAGRAKLCALIARFLLAEDVAPPVA